MEGEGGERRERGEGGGEGKPFGLGDLTPAGVDGMVVTDDRKDRPDPQKHQHSNLVDLYGCQYCWGGRRRIKNKMKKRTGTRER